MSKTKTAILLLLMCQSSVTCCVKGQAQGSLFEFQACQSDSTQSDERIFACSRIIGDSSQPPHIKSEALRNRGFAFVLKSDLTSAMTDVNEAIKLNQNNAKAYLLRSGLFGRSHEFAREIADCTTAITLAPDPNSYYARGNAYMQIEDYSHAVSDFTEAIQTSHTPSQAYYIERAHAYSNMHQNAQALADLEIAQTRFEPTFGFTEAQILVRANKTNEALAQASAVISKYPTYPFAYEGRGYVYETLGQREAAIADYRKALTFLPKLPVALERLKGLGASP